MNIPLFFQRGAMITNIIHYFKSGPDKPLKSADASVIRKEYEFRRWSIFFSITIGYGFYYMCRQSLSVIKKPVLDAGLLDAQQLGVIGAAMTFAYAFGKFFHSFLADHSNARRFMSFGLLASSVVNLLCGFNELFIVFAILWGVNGWFQSMGIGPSVVSISHWFSNRERGTRYGMFSIAHNIGEGLIFIGTTFVVSRFGWHWGFWAPGLVCAIVALVLLRTLSDRPETYGLPPVAEYKNDHAGSAASATAAEIKVMQIAVFKNPWVWVLGISSALMYMDRYAINNWGILYLQEIKGYSLQEAGFVLSFFAIIGFFGSILSGLVSDRFFAARRNVPTLIYGLILIGGLLLFYRNPPGHRLFDIISIGLCGFGIGGLLVYLGGLTAVDISSKKASGAALGMVGVFSYLGATLQDVLSGHLIGASKQMINGKAVYDFDNAFYFWIGASILSLLLACTLWNVKAKE